MLASFLATRPKQEACDDLRNGDQCESTMHQKSTAYWRLALAQKQQVKFYHRSKIRLGEASSFCKTILGEALSPGKRTRPSITRPSLSGSIHHRYVMWKRLSQCCKTSAPRPPGREVVEKNTLKRRVAARSRHLDELRRVRWIQLKSGIRRNHRR